MGFHKYSGRVTAITVFVLLLVLGIFGVVWNGSITGFVVFEENTVSLGSVFNETTTVVLNISSTNSLRASGIVFNGINGSARLYYQDANNSLSLIYESPVAEGTIVFENACVDTCELAMSNVTLLVVLRGENTTLSLSNISYSAVLPTGSIETISIPDINLSNSTTLNLSQYFVETANHPLFFNATVPEQVRAVVSADLLFLSERESGVFTATVFASNGVVNASSSFIIFVGEQNITNETLVSENKSVFVPKSDNVDDKVENELLGKETVPVIVFLKVPSQPAGFGVAAEKNVLKMKKVEGDVVRESVLSSVPSLVSAENYDVVNAFSAEIGVSALDALRNNPNVASIVYDGVMNISLQESIPLVRANDTHVLFTVLNESLTGRGQSICVLDTGVDYAHPALADKIVSGVNVINISAGVMDDNSQSHGTHVSGVASAVAPDSKIVPVKVCDASGTCRASDILAGIDYCINNSIALNISVISGSFGDGGNYNETNCPSWFDPALSAAHEFGIVGVFASGNDGYLNGVHYPACSPFSVSVGASTKQDTFAAFSNRGSRLDVVAPGSSVTSTIVGGGYGTLSGTSVSTPFVAGAIALLKQNAQASQQNFTITSVRNALKNSSVVIDGFSRLDVLSAVKTQLVSNGTPVTNESNSTPPDFRLSVFACDAGDVATLCNITTNRQINSSFINVVNLFVNQSGGLFNATGLANVVINVSGNLTILQGGQINVSGGCFSPPFPPACQNASNITIIVGETLELNGTIGAKGSDNIAGGNSNEGAGGIINISAKTIFVNASGRIDASAGKVAASGFLIGQNGGIIRINASVITILGEINTTGGKPGGGAGTLIYGSGGDINITGENITLNGGISKMVSSDTNYNPAGNPPLLGGASAGKIFINATNSLTINHSIVARGNISSNITIQGNIVNLNSSVFNTTSLVVFGANGTTTINYNTSLWANSSKFTPLPFVIKDTGTARLQFLRATNISTEDNLND
ncbi:S8 family serine peptidase, partial [Candidatus Woesearchaeota archaeon]|nr:S8 family serine peptidase [Candidatus Woesearchaeota archaeon]